MSAAQFMQKSAAAYCKNITVEAPLFVGSCDKVAIGARPDRTPLMPGHQLDRLGWRHPEGDADLGRRGDPAHVQLVADREAQADGLQAVFVPAAPFLGGDFRLLRWRCWRRLVGDRVHAGVRKREWRCSNGCAAAVDVILRPPYWPIIP
jgi:hypothetical protein